MMTEPEAIFTLKDYLYRDTCPVVIKSGSLYFHKEKPEIRLTGLNIQNNTISDIIIDIHISDRANADIETFRDLSLGKMNLTRGNEITFHKFIESENATGFSVAVKKVIFSDESEWEGSAQWMYDALPQMFTPAEKLGDEELGEQYSRSFASEVCGGRDIKAKYAPYRYGKIWLCSCGNINSEEEENCFFCTANAGTQLELIEDTDRLKADLDAFKIAEAERLEQERLERERLRLEAIRKAKRRKKILTTIGVVAMILAAISAIIYNYYISFIVPNSKLEAAEKATGIGNYDVAIRLYEGLGDYEDAPEKLKEVKYKKACFLYDNGEFEEGLEIFTDLGDYKDSAEKLSLADYLEAEALYEDGKFSECLEKLSESENVDGVDELTQSCYLALAEKAVDDAELEAYCENLALITDVNIQSEAEGYLCDKGIDLYLSDGEGAEEYFALVTGEDNLTKITAAKYEKAVSLADENELDSALDIFTELGDYSDCPEQIKKIHYLKGEVFKDDNELDSALDEFTLSGDYDDSAERIKEIHYLKGESRAENKEYSEAISEYELAGDYSDAAEKAEEMHFLSAEKYLSEKDYASALAEYELAGERKDTEEKIRLCRYNVAFACESEGDFASAIDLFGQLGDYENSYSKFVRLSYAYGSQLYDEGEYVKSYEILYAIRGYMPAYLMLVKNGEYYTYIYDADVGPSPNDDEIPLFGDDVLE
ncbi:MAG: hypothetical protein Q4C42_09835 [Clostridia bacterium]|nr:hypothetical protein [Clostridia bacterium]